MTKSYTISWVAALMATLGAAYLLSDWIDGLVKGMFE